MLLMVQNLSATRIVNFMIVKRSRFVVFILNWPVQHHAISLAQECPNQDNLLD